MQDGIDRRADQLAVLRACVRLVELDQDRVDVLEELADLHERLGDIELAAAFGFEAQGLRQRCDDRLEAIRERLDEAISSISGRAS